MLQNRRRSVCRSYRASQWHRRVDRGSALSANQQFRSERDNQADRRFENRLVALARAHDLLTQENWEGAEIGQIVHRSLRAVCPEPGERLQVSGPACRLPPNLALSLSMALHELATNALKHGALSVGGGKVSVEWRVEGSEGSDGSRTLSLTWRELDGPSVVVPETKGFGSRLLERSLARQLVAEASLAFPPFGRALASNSPHHTERTTMTLHGRTLSIFVVEDEALVAMLMEDILLYLGHGVSAIVSRPHQARDIARTGAFDLAILDVNLGGELSYPVAEL